MSDNSFGVSVTAGPAAAFHLNITKELALVAGVVGVGAILVASSSRIRNSNFWKDTEKKVNYAVLGLIATVGLLSSVYTVDLVCGRKCIIKIAAVCIPVATRVVFAVLVSTVAALGIRSLYHMSRGNDDGNTGTSTGFRNQGD